MNKTLFDGLLFRSLAIGYASCGLAAILSAAEPVLTTWPGAAGGAVSLTFDDSLSNQFSVAQPIMDAADIDATFFVITNSQDWEAARAAVLAGHEIGSHSTDGQEFPPSTTPEVKMAASITKIQSELAAVAPNYTVVGLAWPFGNWGFRNPPSGQGHIYINTAAEHFYAGRGAGNALGANNSYNAADPSQWWGPTFGGSAIANSADYVLGDALVNAEVTLSAYNAQLDLVVAQNAWTIFTYHGVEAGAGSGLHVGQAQFSDQVQALAGRDDIWVAPFGEVFTYLKWRAEAAVATSASTASSWEGTVESTLEPWITGLTATLTFDAEVAPEAVTATQDAQALPVAALEGGGFAVTLAVDGGPVSVSWGGSQPTAYEAWSEANQVVGGPTEAPDADGYANLLKFVWGMMPGAWVLADEPQWIVDAQGVGSLSFPAVPLEGQDGVQIQVEGSDNFTSWSSAWDSLSPAEVVPVEGRISVGGLNGARFYRVSAQLLP